jgi:ribosomal protein L11 methyltransferase
MKYYEILFTLTPCTQDARDVLSALAGEAGCETFEDTETGLKAYVQQALFDESALSLALEGFPFDDTRITYTVEEAEDRDWNEQWEQEGFEPIVVANRLVIHDGRHLPAASYPLEIEIDAHMAFGTGTHETTRMICATLLDMNLEGADVLDCGCGTGILGICALKLGARHCTGYDIDEWSADNTRHNAVINHVDQQLTALCGDATLLDTIGQRFQVVMANINRNILLQDMARFRSVIVDGGTLILSGFYKNDCALLESKAQTLGLLLQHTRTDGDWACMVLRATT